MVRATYERVTSYCALPARHAGWSRDALHAQVMRELSDRVVEWQQAHQDVSRTLVAANLRIAEVQTEHDRLTAVIRTLRGYREDEARMLASAARVAQPAPAPRPTSGKHAKLHGLFARLKTPRV